ncbi:hypothetical protein LSH36_1431g00015 [Paralvinella palmiformis]|uniref:Reverse transcriptase domain-containing protein n=1 Tax=Paralvinella palmiformis TaxID=53620 RepID=A0AAD9ITY1_9ANNE|nr:hypothetical protein LSH36_1431g00015 [Paralvinella palmiformis]
MLESLITLGFKGKILAWLKQYLSNRTIVVAHQGFNVNEHLTDTGLPQGSILIPTLFNALLIIILQLAVTTGTKLHAYTDDLVLISYLITSYPKDATSPLPTDDSCRKS